MNRGRAASVIIISGLLLMPVAHRAGKRMSHRSDRSTVESAASNQEGVGPLTAQTVAGDTPAWAARLAPLVRAAQALADRRRERATSDVGRQVAATIVEPEAHRNARRRDLTAAIDEVAPSLSATKRDALATANDRLEERRRELRGRFLLDEITEDQYVAALKDEVRAAIASARRVLDDDEARALVGGPDRDPFDSAPPPPPAAANMPEGEP